MCTHIRTQDLTEKYEANDRRVVLSQTTCSIYIADIAAGQLWIKAKYEKWYWTTACGSNDNKEISRDY